MAITRGTLRLMRGLRRDIGTEVDDVARATTRSWVRAWDDLAPRWSQAVDDMVGEALRRGHWPRPTDMARLPRVMAALDATEQTLGALADQARDRAVAGAGRVITLDAERETGLITSQLPEQEREGLTRHVAGRFAVVEQDTIAARVVGRIRTDAVDVIRTRAQGQITADSMPLSAAATDSMRRELIRGIDVGDNPRRAAQRMLARTEGGFNGGLTRALNISRTEMLDAYRQTSQQIHAANRDVVNAWRWFAELDDRACVACWGEHGTLHPVSEPGPDDHQNGRCSRLPETASWAELGITAPEPPPVTINAEQRFLALPQASQLAIMGPARLQLYQSGRIRWSDLAMRRTNRNWRDSVVPRPVRDLQRVATTRSAPTVPRPVPAPPQWISPTEAETMQQQMLADQPWTTAQQAALAQYTGDAYFAMNRWLRGPAMRAAGVGISDYPAELIAGTLIPNAMAAMRPLPRAVTVTRRTRADAFGLQEVDVAAMRQLTGRTVQDPGFMSTTIRQTDPPTAGRIQLTIDVPRGYRAAYVEGITEAAGEAELILRPGTKLRILAVEETPTGGVAVRAEVVP